ncbi:hypothetical protein [Natranaeroarchaeum aerophilus]|uniref:Uncharacterized protein n=1 Tax=Natranaeroarchaeum aerophilus TaxID=2917711 RepID=A0AAE3K2V1_9EURY|nr:hypothetical protein [Natranaeroarchaeum aerophilus]MCL9812038.1 hypothetical protein [Natranaeroarchaeum aerophilus]
MSNDPASGEHTYSLERTRYGDHWRLDSEGYLHVGRSAAPVDSVSVTYVNCSNQ